MSGGSTRPGFRNRSKNRSNRIGSTCVMPSEYEMRLAAADPRPQVRGARATMSRTTRKYGANPFPRTIPSSYSSRSAIASLISP